MAYKRRPILRTYRDGAGQWRWRLKGGNGRIVADSGESYFRRRDVEGAIRRLYGILATARREVANG